jgi:tetratricopeptide (TPR) repeat protein
MYHAKNANSVAMKCFLKSLSIRKAALGDNDISVAESHCWIGNIHRENEEFEAARESFVAAHRIKSLALGKDHPECAEILHNIGVVCDDLGLYSESLSSFREALIIRKANARSVYDVNEMGDICDTLNCIANVYRAKMDRQRALQFFDQSLKRRARIVSATLSDDDEQVSILLSTYEDVIALLKIELKESSNKSEIPGKMGSLLVEMGLLYDHRLYKPTKALIYFQRALQVFKRMKDFKKIGQVLSHMASIHVKMADNQKALKCFRDALFLQQKSLKGDSLEMADTLHNIGNCLAKDGEFEKCLDTYAESLRIKRNLLPGEHVSIAKTEHCIGLALLQVGKDLDKALGYFLSSMKTRCLLLGNNHLDVSFSLHR